MRRYADLDQLDLMLASTKSERERFSIIQSDRKSDRSRTHKNHRRRTSTGKICEIHQ